MVPVVSGKYIHGSKFMRWLIADEMLRVTVQIPKHDGL